MWSQQKDFGVVLYEIAIAWIAFSTFSYHLRRFFALATICLRQECGKALFYGNACLQAKEGMVGVT